MCLSMLPSGRRTAPQALPPEFYSLTTAGGWAAKLAPGTTGDSVCASLRASGPGSPVGPGIYKAVALWAIEVAFLGLHPANPHRAATALAEFHTGPVSSRCKRLASCCCKPHSSFILYPAAHGGGGKYVKVLIGTKPPAEGGEAAAAGMKQVPAYAYLHRLVCWARHGWPGPITQQQPHHQAAAAGPSSSTTTTALQQEVVEVQGSRGRQLKDVVQPVAMHLGKDDKGKPCRTKLCVNPLHLQWGTPQENTLEAVARRKRGQT